MALWQTLRGVLRMLTTPEEKICESLETQVGALTTSHWDGCGFGRNLSALLMCSGR
jgi:hypothetical protein